MNSTVVILIIGGLAAIIAYVIYTMSNKKNASGGQTTTKSTSQRGGKKDDKDNEIIDGSIRRRKETNIPRKDVLDFMEFDSIADNMIIQENGTKFTMVLQCKGINYDLMSDIEQLAVEEGFIVFLNTLKFPVQLYVQARAVDLKKNLNIYQDSVDDLLTRFNTADENYKALANELDVDFTKVAAAKEERDRMANIVEYAQDITRYVERISLNKNILQRRFYIVFSYFKSEVTSVSEFSEDEIREICHRELYTRGQSIMSALMSCSVTSRLLDSNELAELLFVSYNRDDEKLMDIRTALDSGFYRLYSTSKDVYEKKQELAQKEVEEEAAKRVQEAIRLTLRSAVVQSEDEIVEEFEEKTDRQALEIIRNADLDDDAKNHLTNIIAENHVIGVEERKRERARRRKEQEEIPEGTEEETQTTQEEKPKEADATHTDERLERVMPTAPNVNRNYLDVEVTEEATNDTQKPAEKNNSTLDSSEDDIIV